MKTLAFSLIELMVVIAIVALLTAIAVPSYSAYTQKAKMVTIVRIMDSLKEKSFAYYNLHGEWPQSGADLGYAIGGGGDLTDFNNYNPYISYVVVTRNEAPCGKFLGEIDLGLNLNEFDSNMQQNSPGVLYMEYGDLNGTLISTCSNATDNDPIDPAFSLISGCVNPTYPDFSTMSNAICQ